MSQFSPAPVMNESTQLCLSKGVAGKPSAGDVNGSKGSEKFEDTTPVKSVGKNLFDAKAPGKVAKKGSTKLNKVALVLAADAKVQPAQHLHTPQGKGKQKKATTSTPSPSSVTVKRKFKDDGEEKEVLVKMEDVAEDTQRVLFNVATSSSERPQKVKYSRPLSLMPSSSSSSSEMFLDTPVQSFEVSNRGCGGGGVLLERSPSTIGALSYYPGSSPGVGGVSSSSSAVGSTVATLAQTLTAINSQASTRTVKIVRANSIVVISGNEMKMSGLAVGGTGHYDARLFCSSEPSVWDVETVPYASEKNWPGCVGNGGPKILAGGGSLLINFDPDSNPNYCQDWWRQCEDKLKEAPHMNHLVIVKDEVKLTVEEWAQFIKEWKQLRAAWYAKRAGYDFKQAGSGGEKLTISF